MVSAMGRLFSAIGHWATRIESWLALGSMVMSAGLFAWLGRQWELLANQGWAAVLVFAIALASLFVTALGVGYLAFARARASRKNAIASSNSGQEAEELSASSYSPNPASEAPDPQAYYELVTFTVTKLLPACDALIKFQGAMSERLPDEIAMVLPHFGFQSYPPHFWQNYALLERGINQSEPTLKFAELMHCIRDMELHGYKSVVLQTQALKEAANLSYDGDANLKAARLSWAQAHNEMLEAYEAIKNDIRFSKIPNSQSRSLFWPRKNAQWGDKIDLE